MRMEVNYVQTKTKSIDAGADGEAGGSDRTVKGSGSDVLGAENE